MLKSTTLDQFAIFLSGICLIQCLLLPVVFTMLPVLGSAFVMDDELFHQLMLFLVLPTSAIALTIGCSKHRNFKIVATAVVGLAILVIVAFWGHDIFGHEYEKWVASLGGIIVAISHYQNYRACQAITCEADNCQAAHHH